MKNKRIMNAYDSINPSLSDKQRMLDAILMDAKLEEVPRKNRVDRERQVYTKKQSAIPKRQNLLAPLAAAVAIFLVAGFGISRLASLRPSDPVLAEPPLESTHPQRTAADHYAPVLEKYRRAMAEGWTKEQCEIDGISTRMQEGNDVSRAGYALLDLDNDGREELIIAEESTDRTDNIWDLYTTLEDGTPIQLWLDEQDGGQCRLYEENVISISYSNKHELELTFYDLKSGQLVMREMLDWEDEDTVFHTDADGNTRQVTSKEGQNIGYAYGSQKLDLTWLKNISDSLRDAEALELYTPILEKYRTAQLEGWDRVMCRDNNMSMRTPVENEDESLFYTLYDLNADGTQELIISEYPYREDTDTAFIDIYTVYGGEVKNVMSLFELVGMRSLCEGGYVKDLFLEPGMEYDKYAGFWRLEADRFVTDFKVYQKDGQWYTEGDRGVGESITRKEADEIVANYPPLMLDFIPLGVPVESNTVTGYEHYDAIVNKYVTALTENWSWEQCDAADISRQIMFNTTNKNELGWCLLDIDNNGTEELLVSDGVYLFDLYTLMPTDALPGHLICADSDYYMYCKDGTIEHREHDDTINTYWRWYHLSGIDLVEQDVVYFEAEKHQYHHGNSDRHLKHISEGEVSKFLVNPEKSAMEITLTPFVEKQFVEVREPNYYYEPLIELYRQAIREDWNPGQCMENGISLMIGYYGELYDTLGHNQIDLNGDGNAELIITDGNNIYDLYTVISDEEVGPLRLVDATERKQYFLTTDGYIYEMGSGSAFVGYYSLYTLGQRSLVLERGYMMDAEGNPNNPWFYYDGINKGDPCPTSEAAAITDAIRFEEISFIPFE